MKSKILFLIPFAALLIAASCNKEHLPEYYFKCKVDGKEYVPDNCANCRTAKLLGDTLLILGANRYVESIVVGVLDDPLQTKNYSLNSERTFMGGGQQTTITL